MAEGRKVVATNRRARHNYDILDTYEAGMVLTGSEVKSLRAGQVQLKDAYGLLQGGELWLENAHIAPYSFALEGGHAPERKRKLLLHRREIDRLTGKINEQGLTLVPLQIYFVNGRAKIEIALAKGRHTYDKRKKLVERQQKREMDRAIRHRR
jgi:SsrA-binding protein